MSESRTPMSPIQRRRKHRDPTSGRGADPASRRGAHPTQAPRFPTGTTWPLAANRSSGRRQRGRTEPCSGASDLASCRVLTRRPFRHKLGTPSDDHGAVVPIRHEHDPWQVAPRAVDPRILRRSSLSVRRGPPVAQHALPGERRRSCPASPRRSSGRAPGGVPRPARRESRVRPRRPGPARPLR